jgi:hypothetical protein
MSLQTTLAADAHPAEGQFLLEEQTLNNAKSLIYRAGTRTPTNFQNRRADFETTVNLSKKEGIEAMPPHTKSAQFNSSRARE